MKLTLVQPRLEYRASRDNYDVLWRLCEPLAGALSEDDIVLLPEHFELRTSRVEYEEGIRGLARHVGCHVVGGSHHEDRGDKRVNAGVVCNGRGEIVAAYEKLRPYAEERARVGGGSALGEVSIGGRSVLVLVCADFWFSDLFYRASFLPDLIVVPALSVSRKPTPEYSRALWHHLSVARAYEFGAYVGVSDWAHVPASGGLSASGVAGFADPTALEPESLYASIDGDVKIVPLDFERLDEFRRDRMARGFFWRSPVDAG